MREKIEVVHSAGETMRALVDDILDISKIETGNLTVRSAPLDLRRLLQDAGKFWQGQADAKGVALALDIEGSPRLIIGDEARLRQIVFNIMSNALKFTIEGRVTLTAGTERTDARETLWIAVADSGIGIPEAELDRIFEKFHQVDGGTARRFSGTGLGLAICRSLAETMEGTIAVASREGEGATFTLRLPLLVAATAPVAHDDAIPALASGGLADCGVLLVDANPLGQRMLGKALRGAVRSLDASATLVEAEAKLRGGRFGLVVIQAEAVGDSCDVAAALRQLVEMADGAPVVLLHATPIDVLAGSGVIPIAKPIAASALIAALQRLCPGSGREDAPPLYAPAA